MYLTAKVVAKRYGISVRTLNNKYNSNHTSFDPSFPPRLVLGKRTYRWDPEVLDQHDKKRALGESA